MPLGLVPDDPQTARGHRPRRDFGQEPTLAAAGIADDDGSCDVPAGGGPGNLTERRELRRPTDESARVRKRTTDEVATSAAVLRLGAGARRSSHSADRPHPWIRRRFFTEPNDACQLLPARESQRRTLLGYTGCGAQTVSRIVSRTAVIHRGGARLGAPKSGLHARRDACGQAS
jgi:hypothetical protein